MLVFKRRFDLNFIFIAFLEILCVFNIAILYYVDFETLPFTSVINISLDIAAMLVGLVLLICCTIDEKKSNYEVVYFTAFLVIDFMILFLDEISWIVDKRPELRYLNILDNTVYFILAQFIGFIFLYYVTDLVKIRSERITILRNAYQIALVVSLIAVVLNVKFQYYFSVDKAGVYHRTAFNMLSYVYPYATIIASCVVIIRHRSEFDKFQKIALYLYVVAPIFVGAVSMFVYGLSIMYPLIMLIVLCIYCMFNVSSGREMSRIEHDISLAAKIQEDALPKVYPAFPDRKEFELFGSMVPAKNVGGDFYDYFLIDDDHIALLIADVSGKGVPAALFMMLSKALIRGNCTSWIDSPSDILTKVNEQLCENNEESLFVTVWLGVVTISTGLLMYANAGHEYPTIYRNGGGFRFRKERHSMPLGLFKDTKFDDVEVQLSKGDMIFVYTDGITEAKNISNDFFGGKRLLEALNKEVNVPIDIIVKNVNDSLNGFVDRAPQFDDSTMLIFKYNGSSSIEKYVDDKVTSLKLQATLDNLDQVLDFIKAKLETTGCSKGIANQIYIAVEEIYVNIARYAYQDRVGVAVIKAELEEEPRALSVTFIDNGMKYNPLKKEDPNIKLDASHRKIGGLGIFIVKKSMDYLYYEHTGGNNVFTIKKYLDENTD